MRWMMQAADIFGWCTCSSLYRPMALGTSYRRGSCSYIPAVSLLSPRTSTPMLNVVIMSRVIIVGEPMTTSSTNLHASTLSERSWRFMMGRWGPRRACTSSSVWRPTSRKSPSALAALRTATWPGWNTSNAPSMYTMRAPSSGVRPLLNCTRRRLVGRKHESVVRRGVLLELASFLSASSAPLKLLASGCGSLAIIGLTREQVSMRPTMSVVDTPSVRLTITNLPSFLA
mmetsp:Transcript_38904/g.115729  ORF Transcript_38904/g.115729 Transcript_38904/m.115729 type:complete len:229 (+) Transcript_38904:809-1495(+)